MKKLVAFLLALGVFACGAYSAVGSAEAKTTQAAEGTERFGDCPQQA